MTRQRIPRVGHLYRSGGTLLIVTPCGQAYVDRPQPNAGIPGCPVFVSRCLAAKMLREWRKEVAR